MFSWIVALGQGLFPELHFGKRAQNIAWVRDYLHQRLEEKSEARACTGAGDADCVQMAADH